MFLAEMSKERDGDNEDAAIDLDDAEFPDFREGLEVGVLPENFVGGLVDLVRFSFIYQALLTQNTYHYIICYRTMALRMRATKTKVLKTMGLETHMSRIREEEEERA